MTFHNLATTGPFICDSCVVPLGSFDMGQDEYDHGLPTHEYVQRQPPSNDEGEYREEGGGASLRYPARGRARGE